MGSRRDVTLLSSSVSDTTESDTTGLLFFGGGFGGFGFGRFPSLSHAVPGRIYDAEALFLEQLLADPSARVHSPEEADRASVGLDPTTSGSSSCLHVLLAIQTPMDRGRTPQGQVDGG